MFSTKLSRAAHRAAVSQQSPTAIAAISTSTTHCTARPTPHQRRHSSSKTSSWPPDNNTSKPAPATKASRAGEEQEQSPSPVSAPKTPSKGSKGRAKGGYKRVGQPVEVKKSAEPVDQFAGLPSVPTTQGLDIAGMLGRINNLDELSVLTPANRPQSLQVLLHEPAYIGHHWHPTPYNARNIFHPLRQPPSP